MIHNYLKENILITDGAMGTYYSEITGDNVSFCEMGNIDKPEIIKRIHKEYIDAGAKLIRTNTFSANTRALGFSRNQVKVIIESGCRIAAEAIKDNETFIGASIGPICDSKLDENEDNIIDEYKFIVDTLISCNIDIFIFETFSSLDYLKEIFQYIKEKNSLNFILIQFAITPDGFTRDGLSVNRIINELNSIKLFDAYGFNCGSGPTHLYKALKRLNISGEIISVLPNSGYPEVVNERTVFVNNPEYFADKMEVFKNLGARILGGCCGTTPMHIRKLKEMLNLDKKAIISEVINEVVNVVEVKKKSNVFFRKLEKNEFVIAVELAPPFDISTEKIMSGAKRLKDNGVDLITVPDSPMSKVRVDATIIAAKIKREIGIDAMPHVCCRDKNINAIRSGTLAAHIEGIRNILAITGDPVSDLDKVGIKNVFNLNSFKLIELFTEMNNEVFHEEDINIGAALNLNVLNLEIELSRMEKKIQRGASFFLTQPIYEDKAIEALKRIKKEYNVKILGGILPIVSYKNAQFLNNELSGVNIPNSYVDRFKLDMNKAEAEKVGIDMAVEIANKIKDYVDGIYFMTPFNRVEMIIEIMNKRES
ncbi:MAG: bifunctional homocysteine S-methyltransferase/methylenetetrahydrofolate reductase [Clostridiaceae bacterium]|nr:bifunctional homocysteine S-methyltransferase/methylenetetrahydrofolate reductase [Clostridiaceae bacterium]